MLKRINKKQLIFVSLIAVMLFLTWSFTTLITRAYDRFSDTGVQLDNTRTLTIKSKDVANAFDTFTMSSLNFETSARAESLPAVTTKQVKFKITKLLPASGYKEVLPRVEASYVKSTASIYVSNNVGAGFGDIKLLFNGPYNIEKDLPNTKGNNQTKGAVLFDLDAADHSYGFISTDDGATYSEFDNGSSSQRAQLNKFLSGNSVDGAYMIELIDAPTNQWKTIVEIPTIKNSDSEFRNYFNNFGLTEHINYDPIVYAKVKEKQVPAFNSYANAFSVIKYGAGNELAYAPYFLTSTSVSLTDLQYTGAFNSSYISVPELVPNGPGGKLVRGTSDGFEYFPNTLTITMNLTTACDYSPEQYMNLGMAINNGFEFNESAVVDLPTYYNPGSPSKFGSSTPNKFGTGKVYETFDIRPIVLIRNLFQPSKSVSLLLKEPSVTDYPLDNTKIDVTKSTLPAMYSAYDTSNLSTLKGRGTNLQYPYYNEGDHFYLSSKMGNFNRDQNGNGDKTIRGHITDFILTGSSPALYHKEQGRSTPNVNTENYVTSSEIYSENSNLMIEFGFTAKVMFRGRNFTTGNTKDVGFTPFTIGVTNEDLTNQGILDVATFAVNNSTGTIKKSMNTEAFFTTSQYNAYKVDQNRNPLNDAGFMLATVGNNKLYTYGSFVYNQSIILNHMQTSASISSIMLTSLGIQELMKHPTPSSIAPENYFTSGAVTILPGRTHFSTDGAIIIYGVDPHYEYNIYEIKPPEGYKRGVYNGFYPAVTTDPRGRTFYFFFKQPGLYLSWTQQAIYSMNTDFYDPNSVLRTSSNGYIGGSARWDSGKVTYESISAMRMQIFINVPELGLPNTGGIALGIILILGIASVSTGLYVRKRGLKSGLKKLVS